MRNGIVINDTFYPAAWITDLIDIIADVSTEKVINLNPNPRRPEQELNYKVKEVATMTKKSVPTVTRHIREGLLKAHKVGKSWLISEESYLNYKFNIHS